MGGGGEGTEPIVFRLVMEPRSTMLGGAAVSRLLLDEDEDPKLNSEPSLLVRRTNIEFNKLEPMVYESSTESFISTGFFSA